MEFNNDEEIVDDHHANDSYLNIGTEESYSINFIVDTILENLNEKGFRGARNKCNKYKTFA